MLSAGWLLAAGCAGGGGASTTGGTTGGTNGGSTGGTTGGSSAGSSGGTTGGSSGSTTGGGAPSVQTDFDVAAWHRGTINIAVTVNNAPSAVVTASVGGNTVCTASTSPYTCSVDTTALANGTSTVTLNATAGGLSASTTIEVKIDNELPAIAPIVLNGLAILSDSNDVVLEGVTDGFSGLESIQLWVDGTLYAEGLVPDTSPNSYSLPRVASLPDGSFAAGSVEFRAIDLAGNTTVVPVNATVFVDNLPPQVSITEDSFGTSPTVQVSVSDAGSGLQRVQFFLDGSTTAVTDCLFPAPPAIIGQTQPALTNGAFSCVLTDVTSGEHTIRVVAEDRFDDADSVGPGHRSEDSYTFTVDVLPPVAEDLSGPYVEQEYYALYPRLLLRFDEPVVVADADNVKVCLRVANDPCGSTVVAKTIHPFRRDSATPAGQFDSIAVVVREALEVSSSYRVELAGISDRAGNPADGVKFFETAGNPLPNHQPASPVIVRVGAGVGATPALRLNELARNEQLGHYSFPMTPAGASFEPVYQIEVAFPLDTTMPLPVPTLSCSVRVQSAHSPRGVDCSAAFDSTHMIVTIGTPGPGVPLLADLGVFELTVEGEIPYPRAPGFQTSFSLVLAAIGDTAQPEPPMVGMFQPSSLTNPVYRNGDLMAIGFETPIDPVSLEAGLSLVRVTSTSPLTLEPVPTSLELVDQFGVVVIRPRSVMPPGTYALRVTDELRTIRGGSLTLPIDHVFTVESTQPALAAESVRIEPLGSTAPIAAIPVLHVESPTDFMVTSIAMNDHLRFYELIGEDNVELPVLGYGPREDFDGPAAYNTATFLPLSPSAVQPIIPDGQVRATLQDLVSVNGNSFGIPLVVRNGRTLEFGSSEDPAALVLDLQLTTNNGRLVAFGKIDPGGRPCLEIDVELSFHTGSLSAPNPFVDSSFTVSDGPFCEYRYEWADGIPGTEYVVQARVSQALREHTAVNRLYLPGDQQAAIAALDVDTDSYTVSAVDVSTEERDLVLFTAFVVDAGQPNMLRRFYLRRQSPDPTVFSAEDQNRPDVQWPRGRYMSSYVNGITIDRRVPRGEPVTVFLRSTIPPTSESAKQLPSDSGGDPLPLALRVFSLDERVDSDRETFFHSYDPFTWYDMPNINPLALVSPLVVSNGLKRTDENCVAGNCLSFANADRSRLRLALEASDTGNLVERTGNLALDFWFMPQQAPMPGVDCADVAALIANPPNAEPPTLFGFSPLASQNNALQVYFLPECATNGGDQLLFMVQDALDPQGAQAIFALPTDPLLGTRDFFTENVWSHVGVRFYDDNGNRKIGVAIDGHPPMLAVPFDVDNDTNTDNEQNALSGIFTATGLSSLAFVTFGAPASASVNSPPAESFVTGMFDDIGIYLQDVPYALFDTNYSRLAP